MRTQNPTRLFRAEEKRTSYFEVIPEGIPLEKVMHGDFWAHVRRHLALYDLFEVVAADGSYDAVIRLVYINKINGEMRFRVLSNIEPKAVVPGISISAKTDRFEVRHRGGGRYACIEKATGEMIADGLPKEEATMIQIQAEAGRVPA